MPGLYHPHNRSPPPYRELFIWLHDPMKIPRPIFYSVREIDFHQDINGQTLTRFLD